MSCLFSTVSIANKQLHAVRLPRYGERGEPSALLTTPAPTKDNACKSAGTRRIDLDGFSGSHF